MAEKQDPQFDPQTEIFHADSEARARAALLRGLSAYGCVTIGLIVFDETKRPTGLSPVWFNTRNLSGGQPPDLDFGEVLKDAEKVMPPRIIRWIINKVGPIRLSRLGILAPGLADLTRQTEAQHGLPPAKEIVLYPIYGAGRQFSFFFVFTEDIDKAVLHMIGSVAYTYFNAWKGQLIERADTTDHIRLSPEELEVLRWLAAGKTIEETAIITGRNYQSVRYYLKKARNRYGYATYQQTIVRAALDYGFDPLGQ